VRELGTYGRTPWPLFAGYAFTVVTFPVMRIWASPALIRLYGLTPLEIGLDAAPDLTDRDGRACPRWASHPTASTAQPPVVDRGRGVVA
jgi:hypothetical protein